MRSPDVREELLTPGLLRGALAAKGRGPIERLARYLRVREPERLSDYELVGECVARMRAQDREEDRRRLIG